MPRLRHKNNQDIPSASVTPFRSTSDDTWLLEILFDILAEWAMSKSSGFINWLNVNCKVWNLKNPVQNNEISPHYNH